MALATYVRPQKHNSWFNVIPVRDFAGLTSSRVPFLDSFVTVEATGGRASAGEPTYAVRYEGTHPMLVTLQFGFICVWFGDDLETPDWPFPTLFEEESERAFIISEARVFKHTNLLDLIENNGDPIHFKTVHRWLSSRIWDHEYTDRVFRLKMSGTIRYARSAKSALKRSAARLLPAARYSQELAFHGPGFGAGQITTGVGLTAKLVLAFTPVGDHDLKLHLGASVDESFLPRWIRGVFGLNPFFDLYDLLSLGIARAGVDDTEGDYRIWRHKRSLRDPKLLPGEAHIVKIREWMSQYYLKGFEQPPQAEQETGSKRWVELGPRAAITAKTVHPYTVCGEELIAYRTARGEVRVFEAHCPHQGAHLGHGGTLKKDCVVCPFHHFCFNLDGAYLGTKPDGKPRPQMKLTPVEHRITDDMVEVLVASP
jgi:phenylpropionate dioxygenase-like ring-hydroxylating dioxygenase large terminal subunit